MKRSHWMGLCVTLLAAGCSILRQSASVDPLPEISIAGSPTLEDADGMTVTVMPSESSVVCQEVRRTGSHMVRKECRPRAESRLRSIEAREWLRSGGTEGSVSVVQ